MKNITRPICACVRHDTNTLHIAYDVFTRSSRNLTNSSACPVFRTFQKTACALARSHVQLTRSLLRVYSLSRINARQVRGKNRASEILAYVEDSHPEVFKLLELRE